MGSEWKIGKVIKRHISPNLRNKFNIVLGKRKRDVERLSKIREKKKLQNEINRIAEDTFPKEADADKRAAFSENLYKESKMVKFRGENVSLLKDLYKSVRLYKSKKLDAESLKQGVREFYKTVSDAKNYSDFETVVYENYRHDIGVLAKYSDDLKKGANLDKFKVLTVTEAKDDPDADGKSSVPVTVPTDFKTLKSDLKVKITFEYNGAMKIYDRFVRKYALRGEKAKELKGAIHIPTFDQIILPYFDKVFKEKEKQFKEKWSNIDTSKVHDRFEDELTTIIYFLYEYFVPERCERRAQVFMDEQLKKKKLSVDTDVIPSGKVRGIAANFEKRRK